MIQVGIIGGAGYTGGELIRLLLQHPKVVIDFVHSVSQAGKALSDVHHDLWELNDLVFSSTINPAVDVLFLCMGHGKSAAFLKKNPLPKTTKIIDLSNSFRLSSTANGFVYGLPELNKAKIAQSQKIANPGCFATAIQLALLPLAKAGLLQKEIHTHALTGSTGAGQAPSDTTHFSWRSNNVSIYKAFQHQHLAEIKESLVQLDAAYAAPLRFLPLRGNFSRGIFASLYTTISLSLVDVQNLYQQFYQDAPFVSITQKNPYLKQVVNTNRCLLYLEKQADQLLIVSIIDNLLKGASGQAVQNMNLQFGWPEEMGLQLKATFF